MNVYHFIGGGKMSKNCYISQSNVINLHMLYNLFTYGYVSFKDYDISEQRFMRYIANIRYMLDEFHIYHISIVYDPINRIYKMVGTL